MKSVSVLTKVLAVRCLYAYPCCSTCRRKVRKVDEEENRLWCSHCKRNYKKESVQYRYYVNLTVADSSGMASVTVFGESLQAFFGLTATEFCRYVIGCESKKYLQGVSIDHIIHLSMEKCLLGTMVHLAFQIDTPSRKSWQAPRSSPVLLQNVCHIPTKISRISDFDRGCKIPELLASGIIEISNGKRVRRVIDIFLECIKCFEESTWISSDENLKFSFNAINGEHSVKHTSSQVVLQETSSSANQVELTQLLNTTQPENRGIDLVLSALSSDDESREDINIFISDQLPGEREAKEDCNKVSADSECELDDCYREDNTNDFMGNINLSDIQQSILCAQDFDISKIWTSIGMIDHDNLESVGKNDNSSAVVNAVANQPSCSKAKKCSCLTTGASFHSSVPTPEGSFLAGTANCEAEDSKICVPNSCSKFEVDALFESPSSEDLDAFLAQFNLSCFSRKTGENDGEVTQLCDEENCICSRCNKADENSLLPCKNRSSDFKSSELNVRTYHSSLKVGSVDPAIRPPCSKTVQGPYKGLCSNDSGYAIEHIGTPELFSSRSIQISQPCLSSTPISQLQNNYSKSRLFLRKASVRKTTKHLNSSLRGNLKQSKKKSGTLWKCLRNVDKNLIPCTVTSSTSHSDVSFDEKMENLEVSSVLLLEDPPVSTSSSVSLIQQSETVTDDSLPFESEMEPDDNKETLTRSDLDII